MFLRAGQLYCLRGYCESGIEDALRVEFVTFCHLESPLEVLWRRAAAWRWCLRIVPLLWYGSTVSSHLHVLD